MSCRTTAGGSVSTSLARMVSGLEDKDIQHLFHALKREGEGQPAPSELALSQWRERQQDMLERATRMTEKRKDTMRNKLFRSRNESVPDGSMFYAWQQIEARARQEAVVRSIATAVDLEPPGSQADQYELGPDGRPINVMYASYGSNLHRDRFLTYIEGGTPQGSTRVYPGCTDTTHPEFDIPIRYHGGFRAHFALTSSVWRGGIAFLDKTEDDDTATALGRAYKLSIDQFDEVVHFENGGFVAKTARKVPMDEVLTTGRSVTGPGAYETMVHIGDYQGMPVLTFTAPFSAHEALTRSGSMNRSNVRLPVMTNKPSPAYLRMIGNGLQETFGIDEVAAADYLRGMPGAANAYTRQDIVKILRSPAPAVAPAPDKKKVGYTSATQPAFSGVESARGTGRYMDPESVSRWMNGRKSKPEDDAPKDPRSRRAAQIDQDGVRYRPNKKGEYLPGVKTYAHASEQDEGVAEWGRKVTALDAAVKAATMSHEYWSGRDPESAVTRDAAAELDRVTKAHEEAKAKQAKAKAQTPAQQFPSADTYFAHQWQRMADDAQIKARVLQNQIDRESQKDGGGSKRKIRDLEQKLALATTRAEEAKSKRATAQATADAKAATTAATESNSVGVGRRPNGEFYSGVKTYATPYEQQLGVRNWQSTVHATGRALTRAQDRLAECEQRHQASPSAYTEQTLDSARSWHADAEASHKEATAKYQAALAQKPPLRPESASDPEFLRNALNSTNSQISHAETKRDKAQSAITRRGADAYAIEQATTDLARAENDLIILTRARDQVLDALDKTTADALRPRTTKTKSAQGEATSVKAAAPKAATAKGGATKTAAAKSEPAKTVTAAVNTPKAQKRAPRKAAPSGPRPHYPGVKTYNTGIEQITGLKTWQRGVRAAARDLDRAKAELESVHIAHTNQPTPRTARNLSAITSRFEAAQAAYTEVVTKRDKALNQTPATWMPGAAPDVQVRNLTNAITDLERLIAANTKTADNPRNGSFTREDARTNVEDCTIELGLLRRHLAQAEASLTPTKVAPSKGKKTT